MGWEEALWSIVRIIVAFVIALPIGWERATGRYGPGMRTFPLLSMGSAAFVVIAQHAFPDTPDAEARMIQGLVSGVGFIGAGAIVRGSGHVHGIASAVSIWITMAVGMATAYELYWIAVLLSLSTLFALRLLIPLSPRTFQDEEREKEEGERAEIEEARLEEIEIEKKKVERKRAELEMKKAEWEAGRAARKKEERERSRREDR
ncbi:MAG TPA: MgtC/SapB family protein [Myxococcaceae bacterium]|nr:MgtC/SapB family protein [Myxococcaceae bacterium]